MLSLVCVYKCEFRRPGAQEARGFRSSGGQESARRRSSGAQESIRSSGGQGVTRSGPGVQEN